MKKTTNLESAYLCQCMKITADQFDKLIEKDPHPTFAGLKESCGVGSVCSACELEAKGVVSEHLILHPEKTGLVRKSRRKRGVRERLRLSYREALQKIRSTLGLATHDDHGKPARKDYHTGIVFFRQGTLETHLAISNLTFPESPANANGDGVRFRATLYDGDGRQVATPSERTVASNATLTLSATELFPDVREDFFGGLYVDYLQLCQTGSLRTYGIINGPGARCHFHDKYGVRDDPGHYINTAPFEAGETCWLALANCQPRPYLTDACLDVGGNVQQTRLEIGPMGACFMKVADLFPNLVVPPEGVSPALFWLDNPQHIMLYFFWQHNQTGHWIAQHH